MANGSKGNDVVLESRHLIGLFVVIVVIFGVVFSLGYELGRNQVGTHVQAAASSAPDSDVAAVEPAPKPTLITNPASSSAKSPADTAKSAAKTSAAPAADWDFYKSADSNPPAPHLDKPAKPARQVAAAPTVVAPVKTTINAARPRTTPISEPVKPGKSSSLDAPLLPHGSILLQVAALTRQSDALSMAQILQQKKFPAVVVPPGSDHFFHVQVGPYRDIAAANRARQALENAGFNSIIKR
jgi:cytoskeletal protein RodZ